MALSNNQIDKLGRDLRTGNIDAERLRRLEAFRAEFAGAYRYVEDLLVNTLKLTITGRPSKSTVAIVEKLKRETIRLSQVQDIAGCRILVPDLLAQDRLVRGLNVMLERVEIDDKRDRPTNGYRAVHVIVSFAGRPVEIQVRTYPQHAWAEMSEKLADAFGQSIKYGKGESWAIQFLTELSSLTAGLEASRKQRAEADRRNSFSIRLADRARYARQEKARMEDIRRLFEKTRLRAVG